MDKQSFRKSIGYILLLIMIIVLGTIVIMIVDVGIKREKTSMNDFYLLIVGLSACLGGIVVKKEARCAGTLCKTISYGLIVFGAIGSIFVIIS